MNKNYKVTFVWDTFDPDTIVNVGAETEKQAVEIAKKRIEELKGIEEIRVDEETMDRQIVGKPYDSDYDYSDEDSIDVEEE